MTRPDALDVLDGLVLEVDGAGREVTWGEMAEPWQRTDARAVLEQGDGPRQHFLTRPRGGRKTTDLAAVGLAWLVAQSPQDGRCFIVASDEEQGQELLDAAAEFVRATPGLGPLVPQRSRILNTDNGAQIVVLAADAAGGFGKRKPNLTIVDELAQWGASAGPRRMWTAVVSAVPKVAGGRLVIIITAGDPAHWSYRVLEKARRDVEGVWRVHELPGPLAYRTEQDLAAQRDLLLPSEYAHLHLNEWTAGEDRLVSAEELARCVVLDGPREATVRWRYVIALDLSRTNDNTVASVCHVEPVDDAHRRVVLDRQQVWTPSKARALDQQAVEQWLVWASQAYLGAPVVMDAYDASGLAQSLQRRGVAAQMVPFTAQSVGKLANRLHSLLRHGLLALPDDPDLLEELANVRLRQTAPGVFRMDHDSGRHDDRAVSLALAAEHLLSAEGTSSGPVMLDGFGRLIAPPRPDSTNEERWLWHLHCRRVEREWAVDFDGEEISDPLTVSW